MRYSLLLPVAFLGLAGCVPVQVPAGSQVTGAYVSPAPAGSVSPVMTTTYATPAQYVAPPPTVTYVGPGGATTTTTYQTSVPTTTQYVMPVVNAAPANAP
jgi:hypothetical protein